jgi:lipoprotein-anchoring transpeptidase ErfK/SrfK
VVPLSRQRVTLFRNGQPVRSARVSTGKKSTPTPAGKYIKTDTQADWVSSLYKVSMPFFMRLSCKEIGLHAGMVPWYAASHCCIRMPKGDVQASFKLLKIGDPETIEP